MDINKIKKNITDILLKWQNNNLDSLDVKLKISDLIFDIEADESFESSDKWSIIFEVLTFLEELDHIPIIKDDIPLIINFLNTPQGEESKAWKEWINYWKNIDYETRFEEIKEDFYCKDINCYYLGKTIYKDEN